MWPNVILLNELMVGPTAEKYRTSTFDEWPEIE